ncbi:hypothetical protein BS17DRAFT_691077, partial [Gyrodon lividus]
CATFCEEWNAHPISGEGHDQSPNNMHFMGQLEHGLYMEDEITLHPDVLNHYYGSTRHQQPYHEGGLQESDGEWEDIDDDEATLHHADLPSLIAEEQATQCLHEAAPVPPQVNPFGHQYLEHAFRQALTQVQEVSHIPPELGIREEEWGNEGYSEMETISSSRGQRELVIELPHFIWYPRAVKWCQSPQPHINPNG